jgi:hypothetical protein
MQPTMHFTDYLLWKALGLVALAFIGNFIYTLITGRTLEEARRGEDQKQPPK